MYDSIDPTAIPERAAVVAGYVNGLYAWTPAQWAMFPDAAHVRISVYASADVGDVLDCEQFDATPAQCPGWIKKRQASGLKVPTIYCALSAMAAVQKACKGLTYSIWAADWTGLPHIPAGAVACQYAAEGSFDVSLCAPGWPA